MDSYESEKYHTTKENLKQTIEKYGVAIIPNVFTEKECDDLLSEMWDFFEHITKKWETPIKRKDNKTWKQIYNLFPLHSMLVQYFSIGHAQFAWNARQNQKAIEIFSHFWNTDELLVSFDGSSFHLPPEVTGRGWNKEHSWYHTDQSYTRNKLECLQSFVSLLDINEGDATLAFMEGSNKYHAAFAKEFNIDKTDDWYKLDETEEDFYKERKCTYKKIKCTKGSLVFWDSRTIHCGIEPCKERKVQNIRAVIYLCYMPKYLISKPNLEKKKEAFNNLRTTNHWPCKPKLFGKSPRLYGGKLNEITPITAPILTDVGKKLAGFDNISTDNTDSTNNSNKQIQEQTNQNVNRVAKDNNMDYELPKKKPKPKNKNKL